jgi:glucose-6-phosphate 1-dehydrogenase
VLTLLAMERPISFSAEDIRDEKVFLPIPYPTGGN